MKRLLVKVEGNAAAAHGVEGAAAARVGQMGGAAKQRGMQYYILINQSINQNPHFCVNYLHLNCVNSVRVSFLQKILVCLRKKTLLRLEKLLRYRYPLLPVPFV